MTVKTYLEENVESFRVWLLAAAGYSVLLTASAVAPAAIVAWHVWGALSFETAALALLLYVIYGSWLSGLNGARKTLSREGVRR